MTLDTIRPRTALIVAGGWEGHQPKEVAEVYRRELTARGFEVEVSGTLDSFRDEAHLRSFAVLIPIWTMGEIQDEQAAPVFSAVRSGVGIAGCHGGMCDAFRTNCEWQFMTGGQWVAHPGNEIDHAVRITNPDHFITQDAPSEFAVHSEQYYMHVDPSNHVLAVTRFPTADGPHVPNGPFDMPVIWTRLYGEGRVSYNSLGHHADILDMPEVLPLIIRGALWAARAEDAA